MNDDGMNDEYSFVVNGTFSFSVGEGKNLERIEGEVFEGDAIWTVEDSAAAIVGDEVEWLTRLFELDSK